MKENIIIATAGVFDLIHLGHIYLFKWIKEKFPNSKLVVIVARDENVLKYKGKKPIFNERERLEMVKSIKYVDEAILGDLKDFLKPIREIKPNIFVYGCDQKELFREELEKIGIKVLKAPCFDKYRYSSRLLKNLIKKA